MRKRSDGNLRDRAYVAMREIRRFIEAGIDKQSFRPGDKLPTERVIAAQVRTGRNTVRKTLEALEQEGTIVREIGRGTYVKEVLTPGAAVKAAVPSLANGLAGLNLAQSASPRDLMEFRLSLEPFIAELSVERASSTDIAQMQKAVDQKGRERACRRSRIATTCFTTRSPFRPRNPLFAAFCRHRHQDEKSRQLRSH